MPNLKEVKKIYAGSNLIYPAFSDVTFWLESLTTVIAAYSFTKLKSTNTACCQIRESGGNLESGIGFNAEHRFDETSAQIFTGSNDGLIVSIEDQSGNGYTASQSTPNMQPAIIESGEVVKTNGSQPHLRHDLSNDVLNASLPHNQVYYCIASTWSGITHGNFYTAASGDTELPFGVDFFDMLILTDNSEINTIISNISDRIIDGPYDDYIIRLSFSSNSVFVVSHMDQTSEAGARWDSSMFQNMQFPFALEEDWLTLKIANPSLLTGIFAIQGENLKGTISSKLNDLTNVTNIYLNSNDLCGFLPDFSSISAPSLDKLDLDYNLFTGDFPLLDGASLKRIEVSDNSRLNGALNFPQNCPRLQYFYAFNSALTRFGNPLTDTNPDLDYLYFYNNQIADALPSLASSGLLRLRGYDNQINGNIPTLINCPSLFEIQLNDNQITGVELGFAVTNILNICYLQNNLLTAAAINEILVAFDLAGKTSGALNLGGTGNAAPDSSSGGFDGLAAITNLEAKGSWNITTN
jgi:hypothetical protein